MRIVLFTAVLAAMTATAAPAQLASERDRRAALEHFRAGQELMSAEQFEKAAEAYQQAIGKDPLLTLAHYGLGQANMALKRYASAVQAFTDCREAFRALHGLELKNRAEVERARDDEIRELRESARRIRAAGAARRSQLSADNIERRIDELERQRSTPGGVFQPPAEVSLSLGSAYFRSGRLAEAEREYRAAISANPAMGEAHNNLAVVFLLTERLDQAHEHLKLAKKSGFKVDPRFEKDLKNAEELKRASNKQE